MQSRPVAESESRFDSKLSTLSEEKDTESRESCVQLGKVGTESDGFVTQDLEATWSLGIQPFHVQCQLLCQNLHQKQT